MIEKVLGTRRCKITVIKSDSKQYKQPFFHLIKRHDIYHCDSASGSSSYSLVSLDWEEEEEEEDQLDPDECTDSIDLLTPSGKRIHLGKTS